VEGIFDTTLPPLGGKLVCGAPAAGAPEVKACFSKKELELFLTEEEALVPSC